MSLTYTLTEDEAAGIDRDGWPTEALIQRVTRYASVRSITAPIVVKQGTQIVFSLSEARKNWAQN